MSKASKEVSAPPQPASERRTTRGTAKHYSEMTAAELASATYHLENLRFEETRSLTRTERARFERARAAGRGGRRPRKPKGQTAERVLISIEPKLLKLADAFARAAKQSRSELIAESLKRHIQAG